MPYSQNKKSVKEVRYLNKDFSSFKSNLIEFAKIYFPNTYNDFNESSPGMMFIEMASYVGDVLSYYIDNQFKESLLAFAEEKRTVYNMAQSFGYKPKLASPSYGEIDVYQTVPASTSGTGDNFVSKPDLNYAMKIGTGMQLKSENGITFRTTEDVNFKFSSSYDPMTISVYESSDNVPVSYLLKKSAKIESGEVATERFNFNAAEKYSRISLTPQNVTEIISVTDDDGNNWYEVDFLAQDTVFTDEENLNTEGNDNYADADQAPYLLKLLKTARRFKTFIRTDGRTELRFGAGTSDSPDEEIVPNPDSVGSSLPGSPSKLGQAFDPSNFLNTRTYGQAPSNTTLVITYRYGGGVNHNVRARSITNVTSLDVTLDETGLSGALVGTSRSSLVVNNPDPTAGGKGPESVIEVKNNTLAYFQAQQRAVTKSDYIGRVYALPARYGNVAKAYIVQDTQIDPATISTSKKKKRKKRKKGKGAPEPPRPSIIPNPLAMNLYLLGYDAGKKLTTVNTTVKENIQTYLTQFRMMTDAINIKDAYVINIGVKFNILTKTGYNKEQVILQCIDKIKTFFQIDKWQIGQPIVLADLAYQISLVDGVSAVVPPEDVDENDSANDRPPVTIVNKAAAASGYSGNLYDIKGATKEGVIYPSADPSIFELKFPSLDIEGKVVGDSTGGTSAGGSY
tara:strand:- start:1257 stop:3296 length:2040 start_codon:yes stop_codon:yes gene_type:complete